MDKRVILLVEDNQSDIDLTLRAFEKSRILNPVVVAHDGQEALDLLMGADGQRPVARIQPAVVLLDLKLPGVDGLEVLRRIREHDMTRRLPVVILTSSDEQKDLAESYDKGANSYIRKPVDFDQFAAAVNQLGLYWLVLNVPPPAD